MLILLYHCVTIIEVLNFVYHSLEIRFSSSFYFSNLSNRECGKRCIYYYYNTRFLVCLFSIYQYYSRIVICWLLSAIRRQHVIIMNHSHVTVLWHNTRYFQGLLALLGVVCCWVGSSFAVQGMFTDYDYSKPFFLTYFNTCTFTLYLGVYWATTTSETRHWSRASESIESRICTNETEPLLLSRNERYSTTASTSSDHGNDNSDSAINTDFHHTTTKQDANHNIVSNSKERSMSFQEIASLSAKFCILWFLANWSQNASLAYTSVASSTVIGSTSGLFTLLVGSMAGVEQLTLARSIAAICSLLGVALVTNAPVYSSGPVETPSLAVHLWGDALALLGAFFYGCYTVLLKCQMRNETQADNTLFFGLVGLFNMFGMWPFLLLLHFLGWETFLLPDSNVIWTILFINAILGTFVSDYLWLIAVLLATLWEQRPRTRQQPLATDE
ncbi:hypothetical protein BDF22DRAFT_703093 [Syncephalis plumigaleata]|nr:hypothetical protein BDF22DRAFT_703093 [Syncephalis plumigaleata]